MINEVRLYSTKVHGTYRLPVECVQLDFISPLKNYWRYRRFYCRLQTPLKSGSLKKKVEVQHFRHFFFIFIFFFSGIVALNHLHACFSENKPLQLSYKPKKN